MSRRTIRSMVVAVAALVMVAGCAPAPSTGTSSPPTSPVWIVGDSLSQNVAADITPAPYVGGVGGAGFVNHYYVNEGTILQNTQNLIAQYGVPQRILVVGGVSDHGVPVTQTVAAMAATGSALSATGARVTWITQPKWSDYATELAALNTWIRTQSDVIDCAATVESPFYDSGDHIHPTPAGYALYGACITAHL